MKSLKLGLLKRGLKNIYEILEVQGVLALCIQISLVQISLLPFFFSKFPKIFGVCVFRAIYFIITFFLLANAILGLFISLLQFLGQK